MNHIKFGLKYERGLTMPLGFKIYNSGDPSDPLNHIKFGLKYERGLMNPLGFEISNSRDPSDAMT